jgi:hypothetical protein
MHCAVAVDSLFRMSRDPTHGDVATNSVYNKLPCYSRTAFAVLYALDENGAGRIHLFARNRCVSTPSILQQDKEDVLTIVPSYVYAVS